MPHSIDSTASVLVVGAGPTGLTMACELRRHGVACRIVDKNAAATTQSRATDLQPRTLEVFHDVGVLDEILAHGHKLVGLNFYARGERIVHLALDTLDTPYPWVLGIPQYDTEKILERHLASLGGAVERGVELAAILPTPDGVTCTLLHPDGTWEKVRADWVVGCDGANSSVRQGLHLGFEGTTYAESFLLADLRFESDLRLDEAHGFYGDDAHTILLLPMPGPRNVRLFLSADPDALPELSISTFERIFAQRTHGMPAKMSDPGWMSTFRIHKRMADTYRVGRVFLAGDAAHIHSPISGQGLNLGVQDAYNLAWKLALVVRGRARPALCDSYEVERAPLARFVLADADRQTRLGLLRSRFAQSLRNHVLEVVAHVPSLLNRMLHQGAELTWNYRGTPLVAEDRTSVLDANVVSDRTTEHASIRDWLDFASAPGPGDRAPDARANGTRAFDLFRGVEHALLLFDGAAPTGQGYDHLARVANAVRDRRGRDVRAHVVVLGDARPERLAWDGSVVLDPQGTMHARYGAGAECLYLVRPDGYVGYRALPADEKGVLGYLGKILQ